MQIFESLFYGGLLYFHVNLIFTADLFQNNLFLFQSDVEALQSFVPTSSNSSG